MKTSYYNKGLVVAVILLFICVAFTPSIESDVTISTILLCEGSLSGYVNDTIMNPIEGALVRVYFHETYKEDYTDSSGYYHVTNIPICYCLKNATASKTGYETEWVLLGIGQDTTYDFVLTPSDGNTLYVGGSGEGNYTRIQDAIDDASDGDTVFVYDDSSPYYEHIKVNKRINLIGENKYTTVIDGENKNSAIVKIRINSMSIKGFTIRNGKVGIAIEDAHNNNNITNCRIVYNSDGMSIWGSYNNIVHNIIQHQTDFAITFEHDIKYNTENTISENNISYNGVGISTIMCEGNEISYNEFFKNSGYAVFLLACIGGGVYNIVHHNNFISNNEEMGNSQGYEWPGGNYWFSYLDAEGNYWNDYEGIDEDGDGIGDIPYEIDGYSNDDQFPLMDPLAFNHPPNIPIVEGPNTGFIEIEYIYTITSIDPDEDDIYYFIDWGDGTDSGWLGPYASGSSAVTNHVWFEPGIFCCTAIARDSFDESIVSIFFVNISNVHDVGIEVITEPSGPDEPWPTGIYPVEAVVKNYGMFNETDFNVNAKIFKLTRDELFWEDNVTVTITIEPGDETAIAFSNVTFEEEDGGDYKLLITTELAGDEVPDNDQEKMLFTIDAEPPVTTHIFDGTMGENNWYVSDIIVTLTATDDASGVNYTMYSVDRGEWYQYVNPFVVSDCGEHIVWFYSVDNAGNIEDTNIVDFKIDQTPPVTTCELDGIMEGDVYVTDVTVTLTATDDVSGVAGTFYKLNDGTWQEYSDSFVVSDDGDHTVYFYSVDNAGNTEDIKSEMFTIQHPCPIEIEISGGIGVNAVITNTGDADATDVEWRITITGGLLGLIDKESNGIIPSLVVDNSVTVKSGIFFGLGDISITVIAGCAEETTDGKQFIIFTKVE